MFSNHLKEDLIKQLADLDKFINVVMKGLDIEVTSTGLYKCMHLYIYISIDL